MREVKESPGPGHDGTGGVVVPPFYTQTKQHQPPNQPPGHPSLGPHPSLVGPHPSVRPALLGMRASPGPPGAGPNNPQSHLAGSVGASSNVMPSHPGSNQSEGGQRMHAPGYPNINPHMANVPPGAHGYPSKMGHMSTGPSGPGYGQPGYQHPSSHQYPGSRPPPGHMMQPYPQGYPAGTAPGSQGPQSSMPCQYPPRPPNQPYAYPHFSQPGWPGQGPPTAGMPGGPSMMGGTPTMSGKPPGHMPGQPPGHMPGQPPAHMPGQPPGHMPSQPVQPVSNNVGGRKAHTPPLYMKVQMQHKMQGYPSPAGHQMYPNGPGMPAMMNNRETIQNSMPPPTSSQPAMEGGENHANSGGGGGGGGSNSHSLSNNLPNNINSSNPTQIGPDGNPVLDEGSQTSTVSNNSAASGDDRSTPKPHKESAMMGVHMGGVPMAMPGAPPHMQHPPTPKSFAAASPGTTSMTSQADENDSLSSPCWPRSPAAPSVYVNNQPPPPPPEIYRTTKAGDSLLRLYEMSDSPDRKCWLDKLLRFMEDNKSPILTCPAISKNPLDLYALYLHVREKGGFEEITKNKQWKDVAAVMGIGASSSGSYTLRKHYMKHLLSYECKFDRGGIDPQPIINQIESSQKKKTTKSVSVPSPVGSSSNSMDGFTNGPHMAGGPGMGGPYPQYPPSAEYSGHMQQRPTNQPIAGYQGIPGGQYAGYQVMHGPYGASGSYPNAGGFNPERGYPPGGPPNPAAYGYQQQQAGYPRAGYPPTQQQPYPSDQYGPMANNSPGSSYGNSQLARQLLNPPRNPVPGISQPYQNNSMYPPKPSPSPGPQASPATLTPGQYPQPRRHPDFDKAQTWRPPNSQFPPGFGGPQSQGPPQTQPSWPRPNDSTPQAAPPQWNQVRYPQPTPQNFPNQQQWNNGPYSGSPRKVIPAAGQKVFPLTQTSFKSTGYGNYMGKQLFPMDSVEAVSPILLKRRRMTKSDLSPLDPWRIIMALRCGMVGEVTWAIDVLNILLFDDKSVVYFGLNDMPGLLEVLIEHFRRGLISMFDICADLELGRDDEATGANKRIKAEICEDSDLPWYLPRPSSPSLELDLGTSENNFCPTEKEVLLNGEDFTLTTRTGKSVRVSKRDGQLFVREGVRDWDKWEGFDSGIDTWSVGGGECTAHFIYSMQSSVPKLPFAKLMATVEKPGCPSAVESEPVVDEMMPEEQAVVPTISVRGEIKTEPGSPAASVPVEKLFMEPVKEEKLFGGGSSADQMVPPLPVETDVKPKLPSPAAAILCGEKDITTEPEDNASVSQTTTTTTTSATCSLAKPTEPLAAAKGPVGVKPKRRGNKSLDAILNRIKKHSSSASVAKIFPDTNSLPAAADKDSDSIFDLYLKNDSSAERASQPKREQPAAGYCCPFETQKDSLRVPTAASTTKSPSTVHSPTKLPSVSPIKIGRDPTAATTTSSSSCVSVGERQRSISTASGCSGTTRRESAGFKRPYDDLEGESWAPDEASLSTTTEGQDWLAKRVIAVGTVIRNLSFVPGNEDAMSKNAPLLAVLGKTILLHHVHPARVPNTPHYDREEDTDFGDWCSSLGHDAHWWWPQLNHLHENTLVTLANISGYLDLSYYPEEISRPVLHGLLHWTTCPASYGQDSLPAAGAACLLSPQRLALEALVKLCVLDSNTDLVLATPPFSRLDMLCGQLTRLLCRGEDQVLREFSINLFHYFSAADSGVARVIAMQNGCVSLLTAFIEEAEASAMSVANIQGVKALKENPELMGTSLDMVRRAANTLVNLSRVPDNARVLASCENRLLVLVMSQILDTYVASQLSQVLFNIAQANEDTLPRELISPSVLAEGVARDPTGLLSPLVSKEFDSLTMESLRNIENKNKAIQVIPEKEAECETHQQQQQAKDADEERPMEAQSKAESEETASNRVEDGESIATTTAAIAAGTSRSPESKEPEEDKPVATTSASSSGPSSPASSLASHSAALPTRPPLQSANFADSTLAPHHPLKCSTTPSGVGTKVATPTL